MSALPHTISATWVQDDDLGAEIDVEITYAYTPGSPDTYDASRGGPGGWDPGSAAEVEFMDFDLVMTTWRLPKVIMDAIEAWAREWLGEEGRAAAIEHAEDDLLPDPDAAYDAMRDDRMTGDW